MVGSFCRKLYEEWVWGWSDGIVFSIFMLVYNICNFGFRGYSVLVIIGSLCIWCIYIYEDKLFIYIKMNKLNRREVGLEVLWFLYVKYVVLNFLCYK